MFDKTSSNLLDSVDDYYTCFSDMKKELYVLSIENDGCHACMTASDLSKIVERYSDIMSKKHESLKRDVEHHNTLLKTCRAECERFDRLCVRLAVLGFCLSVAAVLLAAS